MAKSKSNDSELNGAIIGDIGSGEPSAIDDVGNNEFSGDELQPVDESNNRTNDEPANPLEGIGTGDGTDSSSGGNGRRARKSNSGNNNARAGRSKATQSLDIKDAGRKALASQIQGLHAMAGIMTGQPELCAITQDQAEMLVLSVQNVMSQYKIKPNPKVMAWCELGGVLAMVYAPKVLMIRAMQKMNAENRRAAHHSTPTPAAAPHVVPGQMQFA